MYIWLVIMIFLIVIELITTDLITIWFIAGSLISLISALFIDNFIIEFAIFVISSIIFLITTRPLLEKAKAKGNVKTNIDRIVGMRGIVTEEIKKNSIGEVKVDGKRWSAYADKNIKVGSSVVVLSIDSVKLKVEEEGDDK